MRGHIRQRGKRSLAIVLDLGRDATGKRLQKWHTLQGTKRDAQRELTRLLHSMQTGSYVEPSRLTVTEYLQRWLRDYATSSVAPRTYQRYAEIIRCHLNPALGCHPLAKLQPLHIQAGYAASLQHGRIDGRGGLSPRTVLQHHRILREALQHAVKWQLLVRNPADAVEPPRPKAVEMKALDEQGIARLLDAADGSRLHLPIVLAAATGMCRGEVLALRWSAVDLQAGVLSVRQSLEQTRAGLTFKQPKTAKGRRLIALPRLAQDALRQHKAQQAEERLLMGAGYEDLDLVWAHPTGRPMNPDYLTRGFAKLLKNAGLPPIRFHDLRHTHATQLLRHGVHPKVVSERLGHASIGITLDVYSHVLPGLQEEAARKIDLPLRRALTAL